MRTIFLLVIFLMSAPLTLHATIERWVSNVSDNQEEGTLRTVLQDACSSPDNDFIGFWHTSLPLIRIVLKSPLVIPRDCNGTITMQGSTEVETILDGSQISGAGRMPGDTCILNIYSNQNTVSGFTFSRNLQGAAVCVFGQRNDLANLIVGRELATGPAPNRYGVVIDDVFAERFSGMDGSGNIVEASELGPQSVNNLWIHANDVTIYNNSLGNAGKDGIVIAGDGSQVMKNRVFENGGSGIYVAAGASNLRIGGTSTADANMIQGNANGGVAFENNTSTMSVNVTHNVISGNHGPRTNLDLLENGMSPNDLGDGDSGPNGMLNYVETMQAFPLSPAANNQDYWLWGLAFDAKRVELYSVSDADYGQNFFGGGSLWLLDSLVSDHSFSALSKGSSSMKAGTFVTALAFDAKDNTSEFSLSVPVGADKDLDGIIDTNESGGANGTLVEDPDSDDDGLPDVIEDTNRNGKWDIALGETCAYNLDSDGDGLSDWVETHGDGVYDPNEDTNPLIADTDNDGIADGDEDKNKDGIWNAHLLETSPLMMDSDGDGYFDKSDVCPVIPNPGQEKWYCYFSI